MTTLAKLVPPVRVTGTLKKGQFGLDIVPSAIEQRAFEAPVKLASAAEILKQP